MARTQTVTVLFTDLVDSTEVSSRLGPEQADALRQNHFGLLRKAIATSGGTEVKNLGDGLMVVFPSASAGLDGAVAVQQAIETYNRSAADPLELRIGLTTGEATAEDGDYFGEPVIEAARLCAAADGGQIVVSDLLRLHVERRRAHTFHAMGTLALKGLPEPVAAWEVAWEPAPTPVFPLPARLATVASVGFQGRTGELERLGAAYKATAGGDGRRVVLISGEPGIGKTSLATALAADVLDQAAIVLYGRCDEDLGIPYQPWVEALDHLVRYGPPSLFDNLVQTRMAELARLVPELADRTGVGVSGTVADESERYLLFGAVVDLLCRCSEMAPTLLVLDDLHWADGPTIQLLRHVIGSDTRLRLCVVGTYRDSELGAGHPLAGALAVFHREAGVERFGLTGLGDDELLALLESYAGHEIDEDGVFLRDALLEETGGNPFFVGEILRHLAETGVIAQSEAGRWEANIDLVVSGLPVSVREVIGHRVGRLGRSAAQWLTMAAVVGRDFDLELLASVVHVDQEDLAVALEAAVQAGILVEGETPGRFSFAHALFEHSLYRDLSSLRRARAHRAVAEAIEDQCGGDLTARVGELAYHWAHATQPQELHKAIDYARLAGDRALQQLAPDEAIRWYADALQMLDRQPVSDERQRAELLVGLGDAQRQIGDPSHRETLLAAARVAKEHGDTRLLVRAALANHRGIASAIGVVDAERVEVLEYALASDGTDTPQRAQLLATLSSELTFDPDYPRRRDLANEAVDVARRSGDTAALIDALARPCFALQVPTLAEQRLNRMREAASLAENEGDPLARFSANAFLAMALLECGDIAGVDQALATVDEVAQNVGQPTLIWANTVYRSWRALLHGKVKDAERLAFDALQVGVESGQPDALVMNAVQLFSIRMHQGRLGEIVPLLSQGASMSRGVPGGRSFVALAEVLAGESSHGVELLNREALSAFDLPYDVMWLTALCVWAEVTAELTNGEAAAVLYERLAPWKDHIPVTGATVSHCVAYSLGRLAGVLDRPEQAESHLLDALTIDERLGAPFHIAQTKLALGTSMLHRDLARATTYLNEATEIASHHGYELIGRLALEPFE